MNELLKFLAHRKKFWLLPAILVLSLIGLFLVFSSGSALTPFVYTLF
ncbi:MAG: DUF5989 family protein [Bdellovibrionota bacterium]